MTMQTNYTRIINILRIEVLYGSKRLTHRIFCRDVVAVDLLNLSRLERISNNICQVNYSSIIRVFWANTNQILFNLHQPFPPRLLCVLTFSCSLASVYTVSLYSISFCSLSVNLQVNVHTVHWYSSGECVWGLPRAGSSVTLTRSPKLFVTQETAVGILTNIHSQFTDAYCSYLPDIPMVY